MLQVKNHKLKYQLSGRQAFNIMSGISYRLRKTQKSKVKKLNGLKIIYYLTFGLFFVFALTALMSKYSVFGIKIFTVQSGSMEPGLKMGSLILTRADPPYATGDIITFYSQHSQQNVSNTITHRIIAKNDDNVMKQYQTKGDANNSADSIYIFQSKVLGKVIYSIPYLGYPIGFARTLPGLTIIIIIPSVIIIYDEVLKIKKEWQIRKKKRIKEIKNKLRKSIKNVKKTKS